MTHEEFDWISVEDAASIVGIKGPDNFRVWVWNWNRRPEVPKIKRVRGRVDRNSLMEAMRARVELALKRGGAVA